MVTHEPLDKNSFAPDDQPESALLADLEVEGLFGRYDYALPVPVDAVADRLVLFYGENGTGKTTVLRLVWHLLSPANNLGHRTALRRVPFRRLTASLSDGVTLVAEKPRGLTGPLSISLHAGGKTNVSEWGSPESENSLFEDWAPDELAGQLESIPDEYRRAAEGSIERARYLRYLGALGAKPFYLADDRNIYSDELEGDPRTFAEATRHLTRARIESPSEMLGIVAQELETSMRRASEMLQQLALGGATSGSASANSVYLQVLQRLTTPPQQLTENTEDIRAHLITELNELGKRSARFENLDLVPPLAADEFARTLLSVATNRFDVAVEVLGPYLSSLSARLDALQDAQSLIQTFLDQANGFLTDKQLTFSPSSGLRILLRGEKEWLRPAQLSSGERQLVLLLCNALLARRGTRLFLIDEPELSLNATWQRMIVPALLACTAGSPVQFLIATHSIELLSAYRTSIVRLIDSANAAT
jgi:energy-coupling factor transporter ATP-binding protein EcfA2